MTDYKQSYLDYMDSHGIRYIDHDRFHVEVRYSGSNLRSIPVHIFFDKNGEDNVRLVCWKIARYTENQTEVACIMCNTMNKHFRWVKFYTDDDGDVLCEMDAFVDPVWVGEECAKLVRKMVYFVDEAYPLFQIGTGCQGNG